MQTPNTAFYGPTQAPVSSLPGDMSTIIETFEQQVLRRKDKIALVLQNKELSYQALNEWANRLAHYLKKAGVRNETLVAICLPQSIDRVVAMLAVLKAGGAYVPIDPFYPSARVDFILEDTQSPLLITSTQLQSKVSVSGRSIICMDDEFVCSGVDKHPAKNPDQVNSLSDIAYVIYTSGSTGTPKGVLVEHKGLSNFTKYHAGILGIDDRSKALQFASPSFDAAVIDLWIPLLQGATVYLYPDNRIIGESLLDFIKMHHIDILPIIPPTILSSLPQGSDIGELQTIGIGGETCPESVLSNWSARVKIINAYGPTEGTVAVTSHVYKPGDPARIIGNAGANVQLYILDDQLEPVPNGESGELFIGGIQVARTYLNRPEATKEKFIRHPFGSDNRLYRTGDLVKSRADGSLEFIGRKDSQLKIRGLRIEPGEIENAITALDNIKQAVVVARTSHLGHQLLVAFVTCNNWPVSDDLALKKYLRNSLLESLPAYMVPDRFELLEALPITTNGKIDTENLMLADESSDENELYIGIAPDNYEAIIHTVWTKYLPQQRIGPDDDFFKIGGHSLLLTQVYTSLPHNIQRYIHLADLYAFPTIRQLADEIHKREAATELSTEEKELIIIHELLEDAVLKVKIDIPDSVNPDVLANPAHILLTGATGFVGAHLLSDLLDQTRADIYCLVRASDEAAAIERIRHTFKKFLLPWPATEKKIIPVVGDLSKPFLGIHRDLYLDIAKKIEVIFHSGSSVSYLQPYPVIKGPNIVGLQEILRMATTTRTKYLALLSSMGVFSWGRPFTGKTWMSESDDIDQNLNAVSKDLGYIRSKWVMEKMMQSAIEKGLPVINFRLGFAVCNGSTGATVMNQWWGSLVRGCVKIGAFPLVMGLKDELTTVDYMSKSIVHIAKKKESVGKNFHLSPDPENDVSMTDFFAKMNEYYGMDLKGLPYKEWLALWKHDDQHPLYPLLSLFVEDVHKGNSLVESYENTYYYDRSNTRAFLADTSLKPPMFDKKIMTPYLRFMGVL